MAINNALNLDDTGMVAADGAGTFYGRTITAGPGITVDDGDGVAGNPTISALAEPGFSNIGIAYNGGTGVFTVQGATAALSGSNIGYITLQSKTSPGLLTTISVTANQTFIDDTGASEIINNTFGTTAGTAWTANMPFFVYAVSNDAEDAIAFMLCRIPSLGGSPVLADIGAPDDAVADNFNSFWSLENIDETLYDENPCLCIGVFLMTKSGADDWTVAALTTADGIGRFRAGNVFNYDVLIEGNTTPGSGTYSQQTGRYSWTSPETSVFLFVNFSIVLTNHTGTGLVNITTPFNYGSVGTYGVVFLTGATSVPAGTQEIVLESQGNENWSRIRTIDFGTTQSYCSIDTTSTYFGTSFYRVQASN